MNWPFSKPVVKHNVVPRIVQNDFEKEEKKIEHFESMNKKFYKDSKRYVDTIDKVFNSELKLINNLINLASQTGVSNEPIDDDFYLKLNNWKQTHMHEAINEVEKLKATCQYDIIEPIKKLNAIFPNVHMAIRKREQAYNDLLKQQQKFEKLLEKERTGPNLVKIEQFKPSLQLAKEAFQKEHLLLMDQLPKLYESRLSYMYPCVQQLIKAQFEFYDQVTRNYGDLIDDNSVDERLGKQSSSLVHPNGVSSSNGNTKSKIFLPVYDHNIDVDIDRCFSDIKSLSIVSGD
jgi:hypothetical protein